MMKKILCVIDSLGSGGAQRQMVGLATLLKEKGYNVKVLIYHNSLFYADILIESNVSFEIIDDNGSSINRIRKITQYIHKDMPDVVISYLDTPNICTCLSKLRNRRSRLFVSERSYSTTTGKKEFIRFNLYRFADKVVPNSYSQSEYIKKTFGFLAKKVVAIPNFVDLEYFSPISKKGRNDVPEILIVGTIYKVKNTLALIKAVASLKDEGYKFHVSWYGKSNEFKDYFEYVEHCQQEIVRLGVEEYIELKEKSTQIRDCYQSADYFCLPSLFEGTPNVICEAMACGLPVLCSNVCDNPQYVLEGENGFLFDPHDVQSMTNAFKKAFSLDNNQYESFCATSRRLAAEKLSKDRFISDYIKLIEE